MCLLSLTLISSIMKQYTFIVMLLCCFLIKAQNITTAEYYFNGDTANSTSISINQANESFTVATTGLSDGFHDFYIRVFDQAANDGAGAWSHYDRSTFYVASLPSGQNIVAARYWFDEGTTLFDLDIDPMNPSVSESYAIDIGDLEEGFHSFYIQTQIADGTWSHYDRQIIYVKDFNDMPSDIVAAEYFIDEDPGFGNGEAFDFSINAFTVETDNTILEGDHLLCVRVQNADGEWSLYCCAPFNVDETASIEESLYQSTKVFPNPFVDDIQITTQFENEIEKAVIFDMTGKVVYKKENQLDKLSLGNLQQGTYFLKLTSNAQEAIFKIVKK